MKICIGYYDNTGKYIGDKLDNPKRKKFIIVMGNVIKKIAEHANQTPYSNHNIEEWTKCYCDANRIYLYADIYINGKLTNSVKNINRYNYWKDVDTKELIKLLECIFRHVKRTQEETLIEAHNINSPYKMFYPIYV